MPITLNSHVSSSNLIRNWKLALLSAGLFAFIVSIPQLYFWYVRGSEWNRSCAYLDTDELPYAAYTNALIDGRPRRNNPYTGQDDGQFETLFSIQFLPPYALALPARLLKVSANTVFIALLPLAAIAASLVLWLLLVEITNNPHLATVGAVGVLCFGSAAAHSPLQILWGIEPGYDSFPFLRRYIPALPFPIFIASILFMWRALTRNLVWAVWAGLSFVILVYSYFFLWTAAAAWFAVISLLWFFARPEDRSRVLRVTGILAAIGVTGLVPYAWLLMQRATTMDSHQLLESTHAPDLFRAPEVYGILVLCALVYHVKKSQKTFRDPKILFAASFALASFVVFNHRILTGRSLQPFHYEEFVANYWIVLGIVLFLGILRQNFPKRILGYLALGGVLTALLLSVREARVTRVLNLHLDEVRAVALRLGPGRNDEVVFASDFILTHIIPITSRNPVLWARHRYTFSSADWTEQKKRFYQYLYYSNFDETRLSESLHTDFRARWEVFGATRTNPVLTERFEPITEEDINAAVNEYKQFAASFDSGLATNPVLSYAIVSPSDNLSNLDRWYQRSLGEKAGQFIIYRLSLRTPQLGEHSKLP